MDLLFRGMSAHAALPRIPDRICKSLSVYRTSNEAQHVLETKQLSSSTLTALAAQSFSWTSYILFLASTSKYVLAAPDQCLSNMVHGVLFQLLDSCLWDRYQQHLRPWNTGRRQAGLHRDHVDGSMSALHLQEALVGEIWIGHCHLPLQQLFAALGQGGRSSQNCSSLMWQEESHTHLLLSLANLECLHIFLAWKNIFFLVNTKRKSRKV